jgi:hypothetical protein
MPLPVPLGGDVAQRHIRVGVFAATLAIVGSAVAAVIAPGNGIAFAGSGGSSRTSLGGGWFGFFIPTKSYADFTALWDLPTMYPSVTACA